MKLKFRRGKPPFKILERGDLKHIATQKMKKAAKLLKLEPAPVVMDIVKEPERQLLQIARVCPLCLNPLTNGNRHAVIFNGKLTMIHKTCPEMK
jgi:hypothetical protein